MYASSKKRLADNGRRAATVLEQGIQGAKSMSETEIELECAAIEAEEIAVAAEDASVADPRFEDGPALLHARPKLSLVHDCIEALKAMLEADGDPMGVRSGKLAELQQQDASLTAVIRSLEAE